MKILKFKYTKANNEVSERVFVPLTEPAQLFFGIDLSELESAEQDKAIKQLAEVRNACDQLINAKILELGLDRSYRSFTKDRMSEIDISYKGNSCPELIVEKASNLVGS